MSVQKGMVEMIRRRVAAFLALLLWLSLAGVGHAQGTVSDAECQATPGSNPSCCLTS
jgi:hypothetical protein